MDAENPVSRKVASDLSSEETAKWLARFGPNGVKEERTHQSSPCSLSSGRPCRGCLRLRSFWSSR